MITKRRHREHTDFLLEVAQLTLLLDINEPSAVDEFSESDLNDILQCLNHVVDVALELAGKWSVSGNSMLQGSQMDGLVAVTDEMRSIRTDIPLSHDISKQFQLIREKIKDLTGFVTQLSSATESSAVADLLSAFQQLKDQLETVARASSIADLVPAFRNYAEALLLTLHLTEQLRCQLLSRHTAAKLGVSAVALRGLAPELVAKLQTHLEQPTDEAAQNSCKLVLSRVSQVIDDMTSTVMHGSSEGSFDEAESHTIGKFVGCIDEALDCVLALPAIAETVHQDLPSMGGDGQLELLIESVVRHSMTVAAATASSEHHRLVSLACLHLLKSRKQFVQYMQSAAAVAEPDDPNMQQAELAQVDMEAALRDLERLVNAALLYDIVDTFKESAEPLEHLLSAAVTQKQDPAAVPREQPWLGEPRAHRPLQDHAKEFEDHANRICSIADFFASSCAEHNVWKRLNTTTHSLRALQTALLGCVTQPSDCWEVDGLHALARQWHREVRHLVSIMDDSTDVSLFLRETEQQLHAEVEAHAHHWNDTRVGPRRQHLLRGFAHAVVGRAERAAAVARVAVARAASRGGPTYVSLARQCTDDLLKAAAGFHAEAWRLAETADLLDDVDHEQAKRSVDDKLEQLLTALASLRCHVILADSPERAGRHRSPTEQQQQQQQQQRTARHSPVGMVTAEHGSSWGSPGSGFRRLSPARSDTLSVSAFGTPSRLQSPGGGSEHTSEKSLNSTPMGQAATLFVPKLTSTVQAATKDPIIATSRYRESDDDKSTYHRFLSLPVWSSSSMTRDATLSSPSTAEQSSRAVHLASTNITAPFNKATHMKPHEAIRDYLLADNHLRSAIDVDLSSQISRAMEPPHSSVDFGQLLKRANACLDMAFSVGPRDRDNERRRIIRRLRADIAVLTPHLLGLQSAAHAEAGADDAEETSTIVHAWCRAINALEDLCDDCLNPYLKYSNSLVKAALQHNPELLRVETRAIESIRRTGAVLGESVLKSCGSLRPFSSGGSEYMMQQLTRINQLTTDLVCRASLYTNEYSDATGGTEDNRWQVENEKRLQRQALVALSRAWALAVFDLNSRVIELCDDYTSSACAIDGLDYSNCVNETEEARKLLGISLDQPTAEQQQLVSRGAAAIAACQDALAALSLGGSSRQLGLRPDGPTTLFANAHRSARLCAWYHSLQGVHEVIDAAIYGVCRPLHELFTMATNADATLTANKAMQFYQEQIDRRLMDLAGDLEFAVSSVESAANECADIMLKVASQSCVLALKSTDALEKAFGGCVKHTSSGCSLDRGLCKRSFRQLACLVIRLRTTIHRLLRTTSRHSATLQDALRRIDGSHEATSEASIGSASELSLDIMAAASKLLGGGRDADTMLSDFFRRETQKTMMPNSIAGTSSTKNKLTAHQPLAVQSSETTRNGIAAVKALLSKSDKQQSAVDSEQAYVAGSLRQKWEDDSLPVVNAAKQMTEQLHEITHLARLERLEIADQQKLLDLARKMSENSETVLQLARVLLHDTPELRQATKADLLVDCTRAETIATQLQISSSVRGASIDEAETRKLIAHNARELMASTIEAVKNTEAVFIEACGKVSLESSLELEALKPALTWMQRLKEHRRSEGRRAVVNGASGSSSSNNSKGKMELNELGLRIVARNPSGPELCEIFKQR